MGDRLDVDDDTDTVLICFENLSRSPGFVTPCRRMPIPALVRISHLMPPSEYAFPSYSVSTHAHISLAPDALAPRLV